MRTKAFARLISIVLACLSTQAAAFDVASYRIVDLTHPYGEETLYWPSRPASHFELERLAYGETDAGYFYSANRFCTPEHGSTHLDAPIHFARGKKTVDQLALEQLVAPAVRIDVREQARNDRSYRLQVQDVLRFEQRHGKIRPGTIVLLHTGWSHHWPDRTQYFGSESREDARRSGGGRIRMPSPASAGEGLSCRPRSRRAPDCEEPCRKHLSPFDESFSLSRPLSPLASQAVGNAPVNNKLQRKLQRSRRRSIRSVPGIRMLLPQVTGKR